MLRAKGGGDVGGQFIASVNQRMMKRCALGANLSRSIHKNPLSSVFNARVIFFCEILINFCSSGVVFKMKFRGEIQGNETLKWNLPCGTALQRNY